MSALTSTPEQRRETLDTLQSIIPIVRMRRKPYELRMLKNHAAWRAVKTEHYYVDGVSDHYIPAARRAIERFVVRCRKQLIPSQEFFEVYPWDEIAIEDDKAAEAIRAYLSYVLIKHVKLRSWLDQVIRCYLLYGRTVVKNTVRFVDGLVTHKHPLDPRKYLTTKVSQVWPTSRVVDPFLWYFWPESATTLDDMQLIFEDAMLPVEEYKRMANRDQVMKLDYKKLSAPTWPESHTIRLQYSGFSEPSATPTGKEGADQRPSDFVALTECWVRREGEWRQVWIVWNYEAPTIVRDRPSEYPEPPYRFAFARALPGEGYTSGQMSDLEPIQVWLNDQVNIAQDAHNITMSPPVVIDPNRVYRDDSLVWRPRAKWWADPEGIQFAGVPDTSKAGAANVQMVWGLMESFSGANQLAEGQPQRGMPRAGFAVSTLVSLSMAEITSAAEVIEDEILTPTLSDLHRIGLTMTPPNQAMRIPSVMGLPAKNLTPEDLYGDWGFRWVGSMQSQDMQVKAQRLMTFLGMIAKIAPLAMQGGMKVRFDRLIKRIWRDGLGERGSSTILEQMSPEDAVLAMLMGKGMQGMGGLMGGGGVPGATNPGSPEEAERGMARGMQEGAVGQGLGGLQ